MWVTRELRPGISAVIDIEHVHYVDALGEKALHWLNRLGATFIARNTYGVDLRARLQLTVAESEPQKRKGREDALAPSAISQSPRQRTPKEKVRH